MVRLPIAQVGRRHTLVAAIALLCLLGLLPIAQTSARPTPPHPPQFYAQARQMVFLPLVNRSELGQLAVQAILDPDGVPKIAVMNANGRERAVVSGGLMPTLEMVARWAEARLCCQHRPGQRGLNRERRRLGAAAATLQFGY